MLSKKISNLVSKQLPGFVREEYPRFVSFLEAYYEFLEKEHPALSISNNNLLEEVEKLRYVSDVDQSLEQFEEQFFNSFLPYFSKTPEANKDIIIKNIMPLYLAKGSEKSFKLLFRMLFDESVSLSYPRDNILRASDGRWFLQNILDISDSFYTLYTGDGETTEYYVPENYDLNEFTVFVDSVQITNFIYLKEYKKIRFTSAPADGAEIQIFFLNFDATLFKNKRIEGVSSGATAIVEYVNKTRSGISPYYEIFIDSKNLLGTFSNNEILKCILPQEVNITVYFKPYSILERINVIDGGASYNVGDIVPIYGEADEPATAIIESTFSGFVDNVSIQNGGSGFKANNLVYSPDYGLSYFTGRVTTVDSSGVDSANTLNLNNDVISNATSSLISSTYSFLLANTSATVNAVIGTSLSNVTISGLGPITSINVETSNINSTISPTFDVIPANVTSQLTLSNFGIIAKIAIVSGGQNYSAGEYITFTDNGSFRGYGANAQIETVNGSGAITKVKVNYGGLNYDKDNLPTLNVSTVSGNGANLVISNLMGDGESLSAVYSDVAAGKIKTIKLLYPGLNYTEDPIIDLSTLGNGQALANATVKNSVSKSSGRWKTNAGKLSNRDIRIQGKDYFIDFSYVISATVEFKKYKEILKNLLHPAGLVAYSKYTATEVECSSVLNINTESSFESIVTTITVDSSSITVDSSEVEVDQT